MAKTVSTASYYLVAIKRQNPANAQSADDNVKALLGPSCLMTHPLPSAATVSAIEHATILSKMSPGKYFR